MLNVMWSWLNQWLFSLAVEFWVIASQQHEIMEESSSAEEEKKVKESLPSNEIREICEIWATVQNFAEKHHLTKPAAVWTMNMFKANPVSLFYKILQRR